jgi:hypothetical protein
MWDESELGAADRRKRYSGRFASTSPEVVEILATTPNATQVSKEQAAKVHGVALALLQRFNMPPADVFDRWKSVGFDFGKGQPTGKQLRAFADSLPE